MSYKTDSLYSTIETIARTLGKGVHRRHVGQWSLSVERNPLALVYLRQDYKINLGDSPPRAASSIEYFIKFHDEEVHSIGTARADRVKVRFEEWEPLLNNMHEEATQQISCPLDMRSETIYDPNLRALIFGNAPGWGGHGLDARS
jgi:hypothetical protein